MQPLFEIDPPLSDSEILQIIADFPQRWEEWVGPHGGYLYLSPAVEQLTGLPYDQLRQTGPKALLEIAHPLDRERIQQHMKQVLDGDPDDGELEYRLIRSDGSIIWISHQCWPVYRSDGTWLGRRSSNQDITHHKRLHEELSESLRTISALLDQPTDLAVMADADGTIRAVNTPLAQALGKPASELVGQSLWDQFPAELTEIRRAHFEQVIRTGKTLRVEDIGLLAIYDTTIVPVLDESGHVQRVAVLARDITERKRAEDSLKQNTQLISALLEQPIDLAIVTDRAGAILSVNNSVASAVGQTPEQLVGKLLWDIFPAQLLATRQANFEKVLRTRQTIRLEDIGAYGVYDATVTPILNDHGEVQNVAIFARDITERKRAEDSLRQSEALLRTIINHAPMIVNIIDRQGTVVVMDGKALDSALTNRTRQELLGRHMSEVFRDPQEAQKRLQRALAGEEFSVLDRSDSGRTFETRIAPLPGSDGQPDGMIAISFDVSESQAAQAEIDRSRRQLQVILDGVADGITAVDPQINILFSNQAAAQMAGFASVAEYMTAPSIIVNFDLLDENGEPFQMKNLPGPRSLDGQEHPPVIMRYRPRAGGQERWALVNDRPILDEQGELQMVVTISHDITELKQAQRAMEKSQVDLEELVTSRTSDLERLNQNLRSQIERTQQAENALRREISFVDRMLDTAQAIVLVTDISGRVTLINRFTEELLGYSLDEIKGRDWIETLLPEWDRERMRSRFQQALNEQRVRGNINPILTRSGEERQIEWFTSFLRDENEAISGLVAVGHDVTQRLAAEKQTRRNAERAEALARLAARVNAELDLQAVLDIVAQETLQASHYPMCNVMLYDEPTDALHVVAAAGELNHESHTLNPMPRATYQEFLQHKNRYILLRDASLLAPHFHGSLPFSAEARTIISVPMQRDNELVGCLNALSLGEPRPPSDDELELLQALADQASTAIANAHLFQQVSSAKQRLKTLSQRLVEIQEEDRRALARELHDEFGQTLTSQILSLDVALATLDNLSEPVGKARVIVENTRQQTQSLLDQLREICLNLRPAQLDDLGLVPALQATLNRFTSKTEIAVQFKHAGLDRRYPAQIETAVYRIIQEALTNVARYAGVSQAAVILWSDGHTLRLQVEDEGIGFDMDEAATRAASSGLSGMRERAEACGGYLEIETEPGEGACLTAEFPLATEFEQV